MAVARRSAEGVYLQEWRFADAAALTESGGGSLVDPLMQWCREAVGTARRPFGIDHFDLALAVNWPERSAPLSISFQRLRPSGLYAPDGLIGQLRGFIHQLERDLPLHTPGTSAGGVHVAVALFSWGDAAHAALPPTA